MSSSRGARLFPLFGLLAAFLLTACAQNVVRLDYPDTRPLVPKPDAAVVCVVKFEDRRGKAEIGVRRNGNPLQPRSPVDEWVSRAMVDALAGTSLAVSYAQTVEEARQAGAGHIVTGVIEEVWLKEPSLTTLNCSMRVTISLLRGNSSHVLKNTFTAGLTKRVMPGTDAAPEALAETLGDIVQPAARKIEQTLR